ncbi:MAG: hypothetical protein WAZ19_12645 [Anaerolineae bacterium]
MTATKSEVQARAQALMQATNSDEERRGIETLARALLIGGTGLAFNSAINQTAFALIETSTSSGFRRGVGLLAYAIGDGSAPIEPRTEETITIQALQQQIEALAAAVAPSFLLRSAEVVVLDRQGKVIP